MYGFYQPIEAAYCNSTVTLQTVKFNTVIIHHLKQASWPQTKLLHKKLYIDVLRP